MDATAITNTYSTQVYDAQKVQSATTQQKNNTATQTATAKPATDTVTISSQAVAMLANSKGYSPTEEAAEPGYEKTAEMRLGLR